MSLIRLRSWSLLCSTLSLLRLDLISTSRAFALASFARLLASHTC